MPDYPKVSAAQKRANLDALGAAAPWCECHGVTMQWHSSSRVPDGGRWVCPERRKAYRRAARTHYRQWAQGENERNREWKRSKLATDPEWAERERKRKREYMREYRRRLAER